MLKKYYYVSILLGAFALSGCTEEKADSIPSNTESVGKVNIYEMKGFSEINEESLIVITDSEEINSIEEAIKGAEKVPGIVDVFEPHYQVNIGEKTYYLWIHNKEAGTIMDAEDTHTVYKLSDNLVEKLIKFIH